MTYKKSADLILLKLASAGWKTSDASIKTRWAERDGKRVWFKAQSIWRGEKRPENSLWLDTKAIAMLRAEQISEVLCGRF